MAPGILEDRAGQGGEPGKLVLLHDPAVHGAQEYLVDMVEDDLHMVLDIEERVSTDRTVQGKLGPVDLSKEGDSAHDGMVEMIWESNRHSNTRRYIPRYQMDFCF